MKKVIFVLVAFAIIVAATGTAYAPLVMQVDKSKTQDTSTVDLSDKDTNKPVKLLR